MQTDMIAYYGKRAAEYERVYAKSERQDDIVRLRSLLGSAFCNDDILEVSCGTGYWTEAFALAAHSTLACDINPEVLAIARSKCWGSASVEFVQADSYSLPDFGRQFTAAFSGFWWSHIPKRKLTGFLAGLHAKLRRGAKVMFVDNRYVVGSNTPIARTDEHGDSYQVRHLGDGSVHEVLKNFPSEDELLRAVDDMASDVRVTLTEYFWALSYRAK